MKQAILFIVSTMLEVRDLEARRFRAMTEADVPTLARMLSDDLV